MPRASAAPTTVTALALAHFFLREQSTKVETGSADFPTIGAAPRLSSSGAAHGGRTEATRLHRPLLLRLDSGGTVRFVDAIESEPRASLSLNVKLHRIPRAQTSLLGQLRLFDMRDSVLSRLSFYPSPCWSGQATRKTSFLFR